MHCPGGNLTDPIWRELASSEGICSWTPLKTQYSNPNPKHLTNQLWCIDFLTRPTPLIIPPTPCLSWISYATQKLLLDSYKMVEKQSEAFHTFLWDFFQVENIILLHIVLLKFPHVQIACLKLTCCENHVYFNCYCSCLFEPEIIKIGQSSHQIYSNNIVNFHESTTILNACTKKRLSMCVWVCVCTSSS